MRNRLIATAAAGAMAAGLSVATPAAATVTITASVCNSCENVHLIPDDNLGDFVAYGDVQSGAIGVTFTGIETIKTGTGNGLPWVTATDGGITYLDTAIQNGYVFRRAGFNLNDLPGNGDWFVKVSAFNGATLLAQTVFGESNNTKFEIAATGGDVLTHFQIQLVTDIGGQTNVALDGATVLDGVGQIRIEDATAGVPEPATWALMILGFGAAGATLRRRRTVLA